MRIPKQRPALAWLSVCLLLASDFCASGVAAAVLVSRAIPERNGVNVRSFRSAP